MSVEGSLAELVGLPLPSLSLASTTGENFDLGRLPGLAAAVYLFPGTDTRPARKEDPDGLLGTGCTVQAQAFRQHALDFAASRIAVYGLSSVDVSEKRDFAMRERLPFPLLHDRSLALARELGLPTRTSPSDGIVYQRLGLFVRGGVIEWVFHPVAIPRRLAMDMLDWLSEHPHGL